MSARRFLASGQGSPPLRRMNSSGHRADIGFPDSIMLLILSNLGALHEVIGYHSMDTGWPRQSSWICENFSVYEPLHQRPDAEVSAPVKSPEPVHCTCHHCPVVLQLYSSRWWEVYAPPRWAFFDARPPTNCFSPSFTAFPPSLESASSQSQSQRPTSLQSP